MVHSAFDSFELLGHAPTKIHAADSYRSKLLVCVSDGSLRILSPESDSSDVSLPSDRISLTRGLRKEPYLLEKTINGFAKKPILSIEVLRSKDLLLSLSDSIAFHKLPSLEALAVIPKANGANVYSWDDRRGFLCFARQKRLFIFRHDGGRGFVEVKEFGVPDIVKSMTWYGENICIGVKREYMILNSINGALSTVFSSGRIAPPLVVSLPTGELLLGKDNIGVLVDTNGKLVNEGRICWSDAPSQIVIQMPYALGLLPRHIEIRSLQAPYSLIQTVVSRSVHRLGRTNDAIIVSFDYSVHALYPVPLGAQIVQLTASGDFNEALALCKLLPPEDSKLKAARESAIHLRYAHYLFENESHEEAMEHFLASHVDITHVLSLFPDIVVPKSAFLPDSNKLMDIALHSVALSRQSSVLSDDTGSPKEKIASDVKKVSHNSLMALAKFLQKKRSSVIEKATSEGTEEAVLDAVGANFKSNDSGRLKKSHKGHDNAPISSVARDRATILDTASLQALFLTGQSLAALELLKGLNYCNVKICEDFLQKTNHHVALVELLKCNNMHHEALRLLYHLVGESQSEQPQVKLTQKFTPNMIIDYLKPLCGTDPMLVLEFSMPILESNPTETMDLFLSENIPADLVNSYLKQHAPDTQVTYLELMLSMNDALPGNLQKEVVQIYLSKVLEWYTKLSSQQKWDEKAYSPTRKKLLSALESISEHTLDDIINQLPTDALYEERAVLLGKLNQHEVALSLYVQKLHSPELAVSYCDRIYESQHHHHSAKSPNIYVLLLQVYLHRQRKTRDLERQLSRVVSSPSPSIPKVSSRPSIKGKGGRSMRKIVEIEGAEDVPFNLSGTESGKSDGDTDEVVTSDEEDFKIMLDEALDLLSQRWERINGAQALRLLPKETKLKNLLPFLGPLLRKSSEACRNFAVIKRLRQSENLQVKDELYNRRKGVVKVTGDSMCSLCNKKIGTSVFAVYPLGNTLVHFVCFRDSQNMKTARAVSRNR